MVSATELPTNVIANLLAAVLVRNINSPHLAPRQSEFDYSAWYSVVRKLTGVPFHIKPIAQGTTVCLRCGYAPYPRKELRYTIYSYYCTECTSSNQVADYLLEDGPASYAVNYNELPVILQLKIFNNTIKRLTPF